MLESPSTNTSKNSSSLFSGHSPHIERNRSAGASLFGGRNETMRDLGSLVRGTREGNKYADGDRSHEQNHGHNG
jgi:hypothetical protein